MRLVLSILLLLSSLPFTSCAESSAAGVQDPPPSASPVPPGGRLSRLERWRRARFGMFVHWGPVSLVGTEIGWSRRGERRGRKGTGTVPLQVYDNLYRRFDPVRFDPDAWVSLARAAGMRYLVFTSKHHDGFCMFDSSLTDYKITNSPYGRDIVGELAAACRRGELPLGLYYSQPDWRHPDYRNSNHDRYVRYLHGQVQEICTKYGGLETIWFDGLGGRSEDWRARELFATIRRLQPGVLINNRAGLPGDYNTPEQRIGQFDRERPWESCITICRQWAWKPGDRLKDLQECITTLARCAGGDGNLLLNVGPMPDGRIEPRQAERLREIGAWLDRYGESIYATRGGPYRPWIDGACTHRGRRVYLHIFRWSGDRVTLPPLPARVKEARLLGGGLVDCHQDGKGLTIRVAPMYRHPIDTVVAVELDTPANRIPPLAATLPSGSLALGRPVRASNTYRNRSYYGPAKAVDDDPLSRWATDGTVRSAWLQVDLPGEREVGRAVLMESYDRVRRFTIEYRRGQEWLPCWRGTRIGPRLEIRFPPCRSRQFRLNIKESKGGPSIGEFQLLPPGGGRPTSPGRGSR